MARVNVAFGKALKAFAQVAVSSMEGPREENLEKHNALRGAPDLETWT